MDKRGTNGNSDEDDLAGRQAPALYPIGRALRATFDADNHDSLGSELTTLMLNLARVEPPAAVSPAFVTPPVVEAPVQAPRSWRGRIAAWLRPDAPR